MSAQDSAAGIDVEPERVASWMAESPPAQVIDVREPYEREAGHIAGSRHIELVSLSAQADSIERDRPVIFYCRAGSRSMMAAQAPAGRRAYGPKARHTRVQIGRGVADHVPMFVERPKVSAGS